MYSRHELFLRSLECYFGIYFPRCFATRERNTKITLSWALKQFVTWVHTLFSIFLSWSRKIMKWQGQNYGYWCPGSLRRQDISNHDTEYAVHTDPCLLSGGFSSISVLGNDRECIHFGWRRHVVVHWQQGKLQTWANCFMCWFPVANRGPRSLRQPHHPLLCRAS